MVYQPPVGSRDLLPLEVAQKQWIETRLRQVFHRWGYQHIITSTLERLDTLMAGGAIQRSAVLQLQGLHDEDLGLRPELTASIARTAVTRMAQAAYPLRLCYHANVFRRPEEGQHNCQQEFYQAGVELLGAGGCLADAEILLLALDCLAALELDHCALLLGNAGLTRSLLSVFPDKLRDRVRWAIAHLDRLALEALPLSPELRDRALHLMDLRGTPESVLAQVSQLALTPDQQTMVHDLKALLELLHQTQPSPTAPLILDLSLIQTIDYYTGIVFEVVSQGASGVQVLGQGGRYDQLLGLYHPQGESQPGIGFALHMEELHKVLLPTGQLPQARLAGDWLVVAETPAAYAPAIAHARTLRTQNPNAQVELDLGGRSPDASLAYARQRHIPQIARVKPGGDILVEHIPL